MIEQIAPAKLIATRDRGVQMQIVKTLSRYFCGICFVVAGLLHFVAPNFYLKIMPQYLPWHLELVYASGVAEIVLGAMLIFRRLQVLAAWGLILLLIAVFPANIYVYQHQEIMPDVSPVAHLLRLPLQGVFIAWVFWYTRRDRPPAAEANPAT
jgi:uncharacterized membrane protein